ncbi:MAG TPA: hypothetical protein VHL14_05710 [Steroidobacteraceae bacterium]|nr:hypothetical protein [Steroidobacteraceae bacterium]
MIYEVSRGYLSRFSVLMFALWPLMVVADDKGMVMSRSSIPFKIDIEPGDKASLVNVSTSTQYVFIDSQRQPAKLRLFHLNGNEVEAFDERSREKFDNTVYGKESYVPLPPGQRLPLMKIDLHREDGYVEGRIGPYRFVLRPGKYVAIAEWVSERNDYLDESGRALKHKKVWLGTVQSEKFELDVH